MPQARTRKPASTDVTPESRRDAALVSIMNHAATLPTSAAIADFLSVQGKTVRGRVRANTLRTADGVKLGSVHVSKDGQTALTDAHKRAIAYTFAPTDADACESLAASIGK